MPQFRTSACADEPGDRGAFVDETDANYGLRAVAMPYLPTFVFSGFQPL